MKNSDHFSDKHDLAAVIEHALAWCRDVQPKPHREVIAYAEEIPAEIAALAEHISFVVGIPGHDCPGLLHIQVRCLEFHVVCCQDI